jgi:hypothetical protein
MESEAMNQLLLGAIGMAALVIAMFFVHYWRTTRDRLYLFFAASFAVQGFDRFVQGLSIDAADERVAVYLLRLIAYLLIIAAIVDKNRSARR